MDLSNHQPAAHETIAPSALRTLAREALATCHADLLAARRAVLSGRDPTGIHGTRVALRRMRAGATLFGRALADERILALRADAKQFADACGPTRDLDVFLSGVLAEIETALAKRPDLSGELRSFRTTALRLRRSRHDAARRVLSSDMFAAFDARLTDLLAPPPPSPPAQQATGDHPEVSGPPAPGTAATVDAVDFARDKLGRRHRKLRKGLRRVDELDGHGRHDLRLQVKKQRYASAFLAKLFDPKAAAAYIQGAAALQDALGLANDRLVAAQVVADIREVARPKGRLDWISGVLAGWLALQAHEDGGDDKALASATKRFAKAPRFWRGAARRSDRESGEQDE